MACLNDFKAAAFEPMLKEDISTLPKIQFNPQMGDIVAAMNALGDAVEFNMDEPEENATDEEVMQEVMRAYDELKTRDQYKALFAPINKMANNIGSSVVTVFNSLKYSVKPEVDTLKDKVTARITELLDADHNIKEMNGELVAADPKVTFTILDWDKYLNAAGGQNVIMDAYRDITGQESNCNLTDTAYALSILRPSVSQMTIHEETAKDMNERMHAFKNLGGEALEIAKQNVDTINTMCTDSYTFDTFVATQLRGTSNASDLQPILSANLKAVDELYPSLKHYQATPFNVSEEMSDQIAKNTETMNKMFWLVFNQLVSFRKFFSNALVIGDGYVNKDKFEEFAAKGGDEQKIATYLYVNYFSKNIPIPTQGITMEEVEEGGEAAEEAIEEQKASASLGISQARSIASNKALRDVLLSHLESVSESRLPEGMSLSYFVGMKKPIVDRVTHEFSNTPGMALENSLYDFVTSLWYDGTMVQKAHSLFNDEMLRQMEVNPDMDEEDLSLVDANVGAEMVASFLMSSICKVG